MSRPVTMRKLEIHVLKHDTDRVLERLGASRCFQFPAALKHQGKAAGNWAASLQHLRDIRDRLGLVPPTSMPAEVKLPGPAEDELLAKVAGIVAEFSAEEEALATRREQIKDAMGEARAFKGLNLPFRELDHLSFLSVRIGKVSANEIPAMESALGQRALIVPIDGEGTIVAASSKKGRFALETELKRANFKAREFPPDFEGLPPELLPSLEGELEALDRRDEEIAKKKKDLKSAYSELWERLFASYAVAQTIEEVKTGLESTDQAYRLEGWVPKERLPALVGELEKATDGRVAVRVFAPEELDSVKSGEETVPVLLRKRRFVSSFERLVVSYGAPLYGTIDPTPIVAFFFVLLFSIMFGDLGQGLVILLAGLLITSGRVKALLKYKAFGPIFTAVGAGSMFMGFLVGSVFSNEELLVPVTRSLSTAILGHPVDRFLHLMPSASAMGRLFAFFGFTVSVGVIINSIGLIINMTNKWRLGKKGEALLGKTGLSGAVFFWWAVGLGVRIVLGGGIAWFDALGLGIPIVLIFLTDPLRRRLDAGHGAHGGEGEEEEGILVEAVKGAVEVLESVSYYFSNTLSFLRVGAFALSHTVLSFITFQMGTLVRGTGHTAAATLSGYVGEFLVVLFFNLIILVLEGMIVAIQVVRLQYYEFFSKFFTEIGVEFDPFLFEYPKE